MVLLVQQARLDPLVKLVTQVPLAKLVLRAKWEPMAEMVFLEPRAKWEPLAKLVSLAKLARQASPGHKAPRVPLVTRAQPAQLVR
jgi:hypothetical protein